MMRFALPTALLFFTCLALGAAPADKPPVPDFGLMFNEDGDAIFIAGADPDPKVCAQRLEAHLDGLKGTPVRTLVYNIACGSDIMHYPTKVGSTWGWRTTAKDQTKPWDKYLPPLRAAAAAGLDSVGIAGRWAKSNGLLFVPSYRINDAHYVNDPQENVLTGKFWIDNHERVTLKRSPVEEIDTYKHLLDFSHPEVREYRLAVMREACDRYAELMDGFQIDFTRHPFLFPDAPTPEQVGLMTKMIEQLRQHLDELGRRHNRHYALMVRVQPTLKHCRRVGLDVEGWIKRRLVDVVTPSQAMSLGHDMAVDEFAALARPVGAKVHPAILDRHQFAWPFVAKPTEQSYAGAVTWDTSGPHARGAVVNARAMGADGFEVYNFNLPLSDSAKDVLAAAGDPTPARGERIFVVTPRYFTDHLDLYEPPKQLPARLRSGRPLTLKFYVGEDLSQSIAKEPATVVLRVGVWTNGKPAASLGSMTVKLNGQALLSGSPVERFTAVTGKQTRASKHVPPPVQGYLQLPLDRPGMLKKGWNTVFIDTAPADAETKYTLCEVAVGVLPSR